MNTIARWIEKHRTLLSAVQSHAASRKAALYVVGGCLRDLFLFKERSEQTKVDIDFCLRQDAVPFGRGLARKLKAGFVVLDEDHACCRVVLTSRVTLDFTSFRSASLEADLRLRDFSVNSLALPLADILARPTQSHSMVIDPCAGVKDLRSGTLRMCYPKTFVDDPLRILRLFSLAASCRLRPDRAALAAAKKHRLLLKDVSCERVRDELFRLFSSDRCIDQLFSMDRQEVLSVVLPELDGLRKLVRRGANAFDMWRHTLDTLGELEKLLPQVAGDPFVAAYCRQELCPGRSRWQLLKLAALLHDAGKPSTFAMRKGKVTFYGHERVGSAMAADAARRLKLSAAETRSLRRLIFLHLRPGYLASSATVTPRARFRFFRDAADDSLGLVLLALADQRATRGYAALERIRRRYERLMRSLLMEYVRLQQERPAARLVDGHDLMKAFSLDPGPLVGRLLARLQEQQALGKIRDKRQALAAAAALIKRLSFR